MEDAALFWERKCHAQTDELVRLRAAVERLASLLVDEDHRRGLTDAYLADWTAIRREVASQRVRADAAEEKGRVMLAMLKTVWSLLEDRTLKGRYADGLHDQLVRLIDEVEWRKRDE